MTDQANPQDESQNAKQASKAIARYLLACLDALDSNALPAQRRQAIAEFREELNQKITS